MNIDNAKAASCAEASARLHAHHTGLPLYRSHKLVRAAKVEDLFTAIGATSDEATLSLDGGVIVTVTRKWLEARVPPDKSVVGGYFVVYDNGHTSWSPAAAFDDGHRAVDLEELLAELQKKDEGTHPTGHMNASDEGALNVAVGIEDGAPGQSEVVGIHFAKSITWLGMPPDLALTFSETVARRAREILAKSH